MTSIKTQLNALQKRLDKQAVGELARCIIASRTNPAPLLSRADLDADARRAGLAGAVARARLRVGMFADHRAGSVKPSI